MTLIKPFTTNAGRTIARFCADESGATAIEYAMIASGIGAFVAATFYSLGGKVKDLYTRVADLL